MRHRFSMLAIVLVPAAVGACSTPGVTYSQLTESDSSAAAGSNASGDIQFRLGKTLVYIDYDTTALQSYKNAGISPPVRPIKASTTTVEDSRYTYIATSTALFWQQQSLNASYQGDNKLLKSFGTDVTDEIPQYIQAAGEIAGIALLAATAQQGTAPPPPPLALPASIDISSHLATPSPQTVTWTGGTASNGWSYNIQIGPVSAAAVDLNKFMASIDKKSEDIIFYSACREATITLGDNTGYNGKVFDLTIADPNYVETIKLPSSGSVNFHPTCGADVVANTPKTTGPGTALNDLATQAQSVMSGGASKASPGTKTSSATPSPTKSATPAAAIITYPNIINPGNPVGPGSNSIINSGDPVGPGSQQ